METSIHNRCAAVIFAAIVATATPVSFVAAQPDPEGAVCGSAGLIRIPVDRFGYGEGQGEEIQLSSNRCPQALLRPYPHCSSGFRMRPGVDFFLPALPGWIIVSDERRNAEQLAATFPDPADARSRLDAWCWDEQAERVYTADQLTIDISIHQFTGTAGPMLAQRWFAYQRANDLGLKQEVKPQAQLEEDLNEGGPGRVTIEVLDDMVLMAFYNDTEYTVYGRRNLDDRVVRVSVSGNPSVGAWSREVVAYWALAQVFGVKLFPPRS